MNCFIYKSLKKEGLYLYLSRKDDLSVMSSELFNSFGRLVFVMELELTAERKLAKEDASKVIASLESQGFFIQMPPVIVPSALAKANTRLH